MAMARRRSDKPTERPPAIDIVSRLQRIESELPPSERRVAQIVSRDYEAATRMTIADLSGKAKVSQPTVTRFDMNWGHVLLLCSDGLTRHVSDDRIRDVLRSMTSAQQACETLLQEALDDGGTDNITVIVGRAVPQG